MKSDPSKSLKEEITEQAGWLLHDFGFAVVHETYVPESFGNSHVILGSPSFRLQLVRDRGEIGADIASLSEPDTWWDVYRISELVPGANFPLRDLTSVAAFVRDNYSHLSDLFGSDYRRTKQELQRREDKRRQEMWQRFGKK